MKKPKRQDLGYAHFADFILRHIQQSEVSNSITKLWHRSRIWNWPLWYAVVSLWTGSYAFWPTFLSAAKPFAKKESLQIPGPRCFPTDMVRTGGTVPLPSPRPHGFQACFTRGPVMPFAYNASCVILILKILLRTISTSIGSNMPTPIGPMHHRPDENII